jgi:hypothetical protein
MTIINVTYVKNTNIQYDIEDVNLLMTAISDYSNRRPVETTFMIRTNIESEFTPTVINVGNVLEVCVLPPEPAVVMNDDIGNGGS